MSITSTSKNNELVIHLDEQFNFQCQGEFRHEYENNASANIQKITVDFRKTQYIDSSSLGMMLVLREYADENCNLRGAPIEFIHCGSVVMEILGVTNFGKLFAISS